MPIVKLTTATPAFAGAHDFEGRRRGGGDKISEGTFYNGPKFKGTSNL